MMSKATVYPNLPEPLRSVAIEAHYALHDLWTKDVGEPGYDKQKWKRLSGAIDALVRMSNK